MYLWDGFPRLGSVQKNPSWWKASHTGLNPEIKDVSSTVASPNELTSQRHFIFSRRKMSLHEFTSPSMCALLSLVSARHGCVLTCHVTREAHPRNWWGCSLPCCWFFKNTYLYSLTVAKAERKPNANLDELLRTWEKKPREKVAHNLERLTHKVLSTCHSRVKKT